MTSLLKRITRHMPEYHDLPDFQNYTVEISRPTGIRKIYDWGYRNGDMIPIKIKFTSNDLNITKRFPLNGFSVYIVHPVISEGGRHWEMWGIDTDENGNGKVERKTEHINGLGLFSVVVGQKNYGFDPKNCLMTAEITHRDIQRRDMSNVILGAIIGSILGCAATCIATLVAVIIAAQVFGIGVGK